MKTIIMILAFYRELHSFSDRIMMLFLIMTGLQ